MKVLLVFILAFFLNLLLKTFLPESLIPSHKFAQIGLDLCIYLIAFAPPYYIVFKLNLFIEKRKD